MKHPYNTMLSIHAQDILMRAAATEDSAEITKAIREVQVNAPQKFHDETTVALRTFHHEPRMLVPNAGFSVAYAGVGSRK